MGCNVEGGVASVNTALGNRGVAKFGGGEGKGFPVMPEEGAKLLPLP